MKDYWRLHPKGQPLVGTQKREETWDARKLRVGHFRAFASAVELLEGPDLYDVVSLGHPEEWDIIQLGVGDVRRDTDPEAHAYIVEALNEKGRWPMPQWLEDMSKSADPRSAEAAQGRLWLIGFNERKKKAKGQ